MRRCVPQSRRLRQLPSPSLTPESRTDDRAGRTRAAERPDNPGAALLKKEREFERLCRRPRPADIDKVEMVFKDGVGYLLLDPELNFGEANNLTIIVDNVPLKIFKVGGVFFTVLGRADASLPEPHLSIVAAHLAPQNR